VTARQVAEPKIPNSDTKKMFHAVTNSFKHPANLSIDSLPENNAQSRGRKRMKSPKFRALAVKENSAQQFRR
jgi:hypothetical protein